MKPLALLVAVFPVMLAAQAPAGSPELGARQGIETLETTAQRIERQYFDPERGRSIANELRRFASTPDVRATRDARLLAARTTDFLQQFDGHFAQLWAPPVGDGIARPIMAAAEWEPQQNYGFHDVRRLPGNIGYIDLRAFASLDDPGSPARRTADAAMQLVDRSSAIVLDLRNNGGGSAEMVAYLLAYFLPDKPFLVARFRSRGGTMEESWTPSVAGRRRPDVPLIVLISGRTPSAAESFVYALRQAGRKAVLVGERTAGEANPVAYLPIGGGFTAHVPFGSPVDPRTGGNWEGRGISPDVAVTAERAFSEGHALALKAVLATEGDPVRALEPSWALRALSTIPGELRYDASAVVGGYGSRRIAIVGSELLYARGRWPRLELRHVGNLEFAVDTRPDLRIRFEVRDGRAVELHEASARGGVLVFPRDRNVPALAPEKVGLSGGGHAKSRGAGR